MKKVLAVLLFVMGLMLIPTVSSAHVYDRDDSDYPLRYVAYVVHPIGMAIEYGVLRPVHWLTSRPNLSKIFGHKPRPEDEGTYFEWI
jgi:hypothetical protein